MINVAAMQKLYTTFILLILAMAGTMAHAVTYTLNVDNPGNMTVTTGLFEPKKVSLTSGDNSIVDNDMMPYLIIQAKKGVTLGNLTNAAGQILMMPDEAGTISYDTGGCEGQVLYVTSSSESAAEPELAHCTVNVDDPSKFRLYRGALYANEVHLDAGANSVEFDAGTQSTFYIGNVDGVLYSVVHDGAAVSPLGSFYVISGVRDGSVIDINVAAPDVYVDVRFSYSSPDVMGCVSSVTVNDEEVTDYNGNGLSVKAGSVVNISCNTADYDIEAFFVNGEMKAFGGSYSAVVNEPTVFRFNAVRKKFINFILDIDNPQLIAVFDGANEVSRRLIDGLEAGSNRLSLADDGSGKRTLSFITSYGYYIVTATNNTGENFARAGMMDVVDGDNVTLRCALLVRDQEAMIYAMSPEEVYGYSVTGASGQIFYHSDGGYESGIEVLAEGYQVMRFSEGDNPVRIFISAAKEDVPADQPHEDNYNSVVYLNDQLLDGYLGGYSVNLKDGDVLKIFANDEPQKYNVTVSSDTDIPFEVSRDYWIAVPDYSNMSLHEGTVLSIVSGQTDKNIDVKVNGLSVSATDGCEYYVTVDCDMDIAVSDADSSGVDNICTDGADRVTVYNLQGIRLLEDVGRDAVESLPAGLYIINGVKTVVP